jgi:hypothetical protein
MDRKTEETREIVVVEEQDPTVKAIQEELGEFLGVPDASQKKILADLARLHFSLRGPEIIMDLGNYSRPDPPPNKRPSPPSHNEHTSKTRAQGD